MIAGRATPEATATLRQDSRERVRERLSSAHFRAFGDIWLGSIGLAGQIFTDENVELARVLEAGLTVIDAGTAGSVARAGVRAAFERAGGDATALRAGTFVIARGGMIDPGSRAMGARLAHVQRELVAPGLIGWEDYVEGLCLAPRYLSREVEQAQDELGRATIDGYVLEAPHRMLQRRPLEERTGRLIRAFEALEREVERGAISCYGVTLWPLSAPDLNVERILAAAHAAAGVTHHLRIVTLPATLGVLDPRPLDTRWAIETAREAARLGLLVLTRTSELATIGPLPAALRNDLPGLDGDAERIVQLCRSAPGVRVTLASPADAFALEAIARVATVPPNCEAATSLIEDA